MASNGLFQKIITGETNLDRVQTNIANAFNSFNGPFIGGNLLTSIKVGTAPTYINHGLNRTPQVWVLCDQNANAVVWRLSWDTNTIELEASTDCTISMWVN